MPADKRLSRFSTLSIKKVNIKFSTFFKTPYLEIAVSVVVGFCALCIFTSISILDVTNIAWLQVGERPVFYMGWAFSRNADWTIPLGMLPSYGLELQNSIVYNDSIPLLATFFKIFRKILPEPFQYFGLWILLCFILQAYFGWKIVSLFIKNNWERLFATILLVISPPMLYRMDAHLGLGGHFFLLAALYLALCPDMKKQLTRWSVLLVIAVLCHFYLFFMALLFWAASAATRVWLKKTNIKSIIIETACIFVLVIFFAWLVGYFTVSDGVTGNSSYGFYRANLVTFFNPQKWSFIIPEITIGWGDYEGFSYYGLGIILLFFMSLPFVFTRFKEYKNIVTKYWILLSIAIVSFFFGLSNTISFSTWDIIQYKLPESVIHLSSILRMSGRFVWPLFYISIIFYLYSVVKYYKENIVILFLLIACFFQFLDTRALWMHSKYTYRMPPSKTWDIVMKHAFWEQAAQKYSKMRGIFVFRDLTYWADIGYFALTHHLGTDMTITARTDMKRFEKQNNETLNRFDTGHYESDTFYIFDNSYLSRFTERVQKAVEKVDRKKDLIAKIDVFYVIAPGWKECSDCMTLKELEVEDIPLPKE